MKNEWKKILLEIQQDFPKDYELWFIQISYKDFIKKDQTLVLTVPNGTILSIVQERFIPVILEYFEKFISLTPKIELEIDAENSIFTSIEEKPLKHLQERNFEKSTKKNSFQIPDLNPKFTFERFVSGSNTDLAYKAAQLIANQADGNFERFNPFFIYGGVGLGKTHLMQSIGNYIINHSPHLKVIYVTAEKYLNDYIEATLTKNFINFRNYYREANILLMDDVQFLENKEKIQDEIFNNFNRLYQNNQQIVLTCDKHPKDLKNVQERLISRFSWGLTVDIKAPDLQTRKSIIIKKLEESKVLDLLDASIVDFLAENITQNIRDIESAVTKITSILLLTPKPITLELIEEEMKDILTSKKVQSLGVTVLTIQKTVATYYNISIADLKSKNRSQHIAFPRHMAIYICKQIVNMSLSKIGEEFDNRDHSTVLSSIKKVEQELKTILSVRNDYEEIMKKLTTNPQ